jgi:hypothetical protein
MINLLEMFGKKYKVVFDKQRYSFDIKTTNSKPCRVSTDKCWYYSIPCKHGEISIADDKDGLIFYCTSARIAKNIENKMTGKPVNCQITDSDAVIYFPLQYIKEIFSFAKPKRKKQMNKEQKEKMLSGLERYRKKKAENEP